MRLTAMMGVLVTLIGAGFPLIHAGSPSNDAALLKAAHKGAVEEVKKLLAANANPNAVGQSGRPALVEAAMSGQAKAISALLGAGAAVNQSDRDGDTALIWAAVYVKVMGEKRGAPGMACLRVLLDGGANANAQNRAGFTALMWAAESSSSTMVKMLLDHGADVSLRTVSGQTAEMRALGAKRSENASLLLDHAAAKLSAPMNERTAIVGQPAASDAHSLGSAQDQTLQADIAFWDSVRDSPDPAALRLYIDRFPDGQFLELARARLVTVSERRVNSSSPATIYVYRVKHDIGRLSFFIEDKQIARIGSGRYLKLRVPPGQIHIVADNLRMPGRMLDAAGGETCYILLNLSLSKGWLLELENATVGQARMQTLQPVEAEWIFDPSLVAKD